MATLLKIPNGCFAADDNEELRRKREELKRKLLGVPKYYIHFPAEVETARLEGILYGNILKDEETGILHYYITSNSRQNLEIGRIFKEKPAQPLSGNMLTGYYEDGLLLFRVQDSLCRKEPYPLFESWISGKIEIKYLEE
ncbi:MAG: hypothetical protein LBH19_02135 [Dysgonamonadaceae bacterium]|jgi:hypothetical protein|nr:hypothetical protein [Dysgonamonadaceae bacterium]